MTIKDQIKELKEKSKKRKFTQTCDLVINLKEIDLKKTNLKIDDIFVLPKGSGKDAFITIFSDSFDDIEGCQMLKSSKIMDLGTNKKDLKKIIKETDFFFAEPKLMPLVGKHLGKFLAPIGKMPKPIAGDVKKIMGGYKRGIKIILKKQLLIQTAIGTENMKDEDLEANINAVLTFVESKLPRGKDNIKDARLKFTMSAPVKLKVK